MAINNFAKLFPKCRQDKTSVIGMIHVKALPGTPLAKHSIPEIVEFARKEGQVYKRFEVDGVLVENMRDIPYVTEADSGPKTVAFMTSLYRNEGHSWRDHSLWHPNFGGTQ